MAQQQYGGGHPAGFPGYHQGGTQQQQQQQQPFAPPPTYDMNAMAAAWEQLQQQQQLSPIFYHTSPPGAAAGGNGQPSHQHQQQLSPTLQYPYMYPYPLQGGAGGGQMSPPPHQQFYATPTFGYPMQHAVNPPPPQQQAAAAKPPRRSNIGSSGSRRPNASSNENVYSDHAASSSGSLPAMSEIFSSGGNGASSAVGHSYMSPLVDSGGATGGSRKEGAAAGYGSLSSAAPKVYNAPPSPSSSSRRLPPSGRSPTIPRTDSGNDLQQQEQQQQPQKRKGSSIGSKKSIHRRTHSDTPLRVLPRHKRANSSEFLPPSGASHNRARTLSGGNPFVSKPTHRRTNSTNSMVSQGDMSQVSIRSNIVKSSLFAGVDPTTGNVLMHFPYEAIRVVMIPDPATQPKKKPAKFKSQYQSIPNYDESANNDNSHLTIGHLYSDGPLNVESYYEDYIKVSEDLEQGDSPQWESLETNQRNASNGGLCGCQCSNCNACIGKQELLPLENYVLPVSDDIYRRMMGEVASARTMPCGLFFCGHHEDVAHPSIWIAGTFLILFFGTLIALSFYTECSTFECLIS